MEGNTGYKGLAWVKTLEENNNVEVVGIGGIGSWLTLLLSQIGIGCRIYDDDVVEDRNTAQLFATEQIGSAKVAACKDVCLLFDPNCNIRISQDKVLGSFRRSYPLFLGIDNIPTRAELVVSNNHKNIIIDGRLNAEQYEIYVLTDNVQYANKLLSKEEAIDLYINEFCSEDIDTPVCSLKQTPHFASMIAARMVELYTKYLYKKDEDFKDLILPFKTTYSLWD